MNINGMGKDAKTVENKYGAKQSDAPMALHLIDPNFALNFISKVKNKTFAHNAIYKIYRYIQTKDENFIYGAIVDVEVSTEQLFCIIGRILKEGTEKYPINNWRKIPREEHINHALNHLIAFIVGDTQDEHLEHALCRLMMSVSTEETLNFDYAKVKNNNGLEGLWN